MMGYPGPGKDPLATHKFVQSVGNRCAVVGCGRTIDAHMVFAEWERPCLRDHNELQTRQFPTPQGVEWAICRDCKVQLEAPANRRMK